MQLPIDSQKGRESAEAAGFKIVPNQVSPQASTVMLAEIPAEMFDRYPDIMASIEAIQSNSFILEIMGLKNPQEASLILLSNLAQGKKVGEGI